MLKQISAGLLEKINKEMNEIATTELSELSKERGYFYIIVFVYFNLNFLSYSYRALPFRSL